MTPSRRLLSAGAITVGLLAASASPAAILKVPTASYPLSDAEFRTLVGPAVKAAQAEDCPKVFGTLDPALPRLSGRNRNAAQLLRLPCLIGGGRGAEADTVYREVAASDPQSPLVRSIGVVVAISTGDMVEAGNRLADVADEAPAALARLTGRAVSAITQGLTEQRAYPVRDRLFIALARADWQPRDRPDMRDSFAVGAIDALLSKGRREEASALLPRVDAPEMLANMAMERHYQPLWPAIEARMGPNGSVAVDRFAASRLDAFANGPDDRNARRDAARSFILLGRFPEVSEVAAPVAIADTMTEADVAIVRYDAQALAAQGRIDAAVERLRPFSTVDLARAPNAASGVVSLAELLDEHGRTQDALAVARSGIARGSEALSAWGVGWLKRTEVCSLATLGKTAEANRLGDALKVNAKTNEAAAVEGLLCLKRGDDAAALAVATLATPEGADVLADQFQPRDALWASSGSRLRALWSEFRQRPDVRAAFDKAARILPESLWPAREARPIPRVKRTDDIPVT